MSNIKHSREPWSLGNIENQAQGGKMQCLDSKEHISLGRIWITSNGIDSSKNKANAERIVACVNACEGISNDELNHYRVKDLIVSRESLLNAEVCLLQEKRDLCANLKEAQTRLEMQRTETKRIEALCMHSVDVNNNMLKKQRALEAELKEAKKLAERQVDELTLTRNFESQLRQTNRGMQQELDMRMKRNDELAKEGAKLARELHATKEVLETQKIAYETLHQAWETQRDTIARYQEGSGLESTSEAEQQLEKQRWIFKNLARDLQAVLRAASFEQPNGYANVNTIYAVLRLHGALPDGN